MGTDIDVTKPADTDVIADYPTEERDHRTDLQTLIATEHYEGASGNDRHKIGVYANDAARDAVITSPASGNFAFQVGSSPGANAPRMTALGFHDGTDWHKGYFIPTGTVLNVAFNPATPPEGFLACNGANVSKTTYADLFAVIGTAFDEQDGVAAPGGSEFRVPLLGGHTVVGLTAGKKGQPGWVRNVSGLKDVFVTGTYSGSARLIYIVEITGEGTPDTFRWSDDAGATFTSGVSVSSTNALSNGLTLNWQATTGHGDGDIWIFVAEPALAAVGGTIGVSAWQLVVNETPSHDHGGETGDPAGTDEYQGNTPKGTTYSDSGGATSNFGRGGSVSVGTTNIEDVDHHHAISAQGGDRAHDTQPHAVVLGSMIKT